VPRISFMSGPIFMFMHGDAAVDESPERAAAGMEPVDVEAGEYEVIYDGSGLVYEPIVVEKYRVRLAPTKRRDLDDLVRRLREFGDRAGLAMPDDSHNFTLEAARVLAAWEWGRRWPKRPRWLSQRIHGVGPKFGSD